MSMILDGANDIIRLTTDAAGSIEVLASFVKNASGVITPDNQPTIQTTATTQTIVSAPGASTQLAVVDLSLYNDHASQAVLCTLEYFDGSNAKTLFECSLGAGERLGYSESGIWTKYDVNGLAIVSTTSVASQAEMEAGTANDKMVTPANYHWHAASTKFWCKANVSGAASASYNVTSVTDGGTGIATINIANDFSSANWCCTYGIENIDASIDASTDVQCPQVGLAGQAAGSVQVICGNASGTAAVDPTSWFVSGNGDL